MAYYNYKKLKLLAQERNVKNYARVNCEALALKLGVPYERSGFFDLYIREKIKTPVGIIGVDPTTGEALVKFSSINRTRKNLKVSFRLLYEYIETREVVSVFGHDVILVREY